MKFEKLIKNISNKDSVFRINEEFLDATKDRGEKKKREDVAAKIEASKKQLKMTDKEVVEKIVSDASGVMSILKKCMQNPKEGDPNKILMEKRVILTKYLNTLNSEVVKMLEEEKRVSLANRK